LVRHKAADGSGGQGQQAQEGNSRTQGPQVDLAPPRIDDYKWPLLFGLVAIFALGAILLSRKQVVMVPAEENERASPAQSKKSRRQSCKEAGRRRKPSRNR